MPITWKAFKFDGEPEKVCDCAPLFRPTPLPARDDAHSCWYELWLAGHFLLSNRRLVSAGLRLANIRFLSAALLGLVHSQPRTVSWLYAHPAGGGRAGSPVLVFGPA